jgi:hypothetical protein
MLIVVDIFYTIVHLIIILFNLTGWMFPSTRRWHLIVISLTAFSWFILGLWFGMGYCPVTDWQWSVKERLGESDLPASFITYIINNKLGGSFSDSFVNTITAVIFFLVVILTVLTNFRKSKNRH